MHIPYGSSPPSARPTRGGGNRKIRDQPHALEPTLSKEIVLGPESVGGLSICENHSGNPASPCNRLGFCHVRLIWFRPRANGIRRARRGFEGEAASPKDNHRPSGSQERWGEMRVLTASQHLATLHRTSLKPAGRLLSKSVCALFYSSVRSRRVPPSRSTAWRRACRRAVRCGQLVCTGQ
jgi:hypothetical protein